MRSGTSEEGAAPHGTGAARPSVYEDRPVVEVVDEEWRAEQLRATGIGYGWRPLDEFLRDRR